MRQYKRNLGLLTSRYGEFERRVLEIFAADPEVQALRLTSDNDIHLMYLVKDGLLRVVDEQSRVWIQGVLSHRVYAITPEGRAFIKKWLEARDVDAP